METLAQADHTAPIASPTTKNLEPPTDLSYFAKGSSLLTEVNHHAATAILRLLDGLLNTEDEVGTASTNVGSENITAIALFRGVDS